MIVKVLNEAGYREAILGMSLSFKDEGIPLEEWVESSKFLDQAPKTAKGLAFKDGGHNKFIESIVVWVFIKAPRGFWQEFDTYRTGVTKNSASTMHTIQNRLLNKSDFTEHTDPDIISSFNKILSEETNNFTNKKRLRGDSLKRVKDNIPEGFLQSRVVCLNYKTIRNMFLQRHGHAYEYWHEFIKQMTDQLAYTYLLPNPLSK